MMVTPVIKSFHCIGAIGDFEIDENESPPNPKHFGVSLVLVIGEKDSLGEEFFDLYVCTPSWLAEGMKKDDIEMGRHYLFMAEYNYKRLITWIEDYVASCASETWAECTAKLSRLGMWEFEDHTECKK
jgi:hypothetical protein